MWPESALAVRRITVKLHRRTFHFSHFTGLSMKSCSLHSVSVWHWKKFSPCRQTVKVAEWHREKKSSVIVTRACDFNSCLRKLWSHFKSPNSTIYSIYIKLYYLCVYGFFWNEYHEIISVPATEQTTWPIVQQWVACWQELKGAFRHYMM